MNKSILVCFVVDFLLPMRCRFTDVLCFFAHRKSEMKDQPGLVCTTANQLVVLINITASQCSNRRRHCFARCHCNNVEYCHTISRVFFSQSLAHKDKSHISLRGKCTQDISPYDIPSKCSALLKHDQSRNCNIQVSERAKRGVRRRSQILCESVTNVNARKQKHKLHSPVIFLLVFLFLRCFGGLSGSHLSFWSGSLSVSSDIVWFVRPELVVEVVVVSAEGRLKRHECSRFAVSLTRSSQLEMGISLVKLGRILSQTYFPTKGIPFSKSKFHLAVFSSVSFRFSLNKSSLICSWFTGPNNCRQTEWLGTMFGFSLRGQDGPKFICAAVISSCERTTKSSTQHSHVEVRNCNK